MIPTNMNTRPRSSSGLGDTKRRDFINTFGGLNHRKVIGDGEWAAISNFCTDDYPLLSSRKMLGRMSQKFFSEIFAGDYYVSGTRRSGVYLLCSEDDYLYWTDFNEGTGLIKTSASFQDAGEIKRTFAQFGAYLVVWPDKVMYNTITNTSKKMELNITPIDGGGDIASGRVNWATPYENGFKAYYPTISSSAPASPDDGDCWLDTSAGFNIMKRYSKITDSWITEPDTYIAVSSTAWYNVGDPQGPAYRLTLKDHISKGDLIKVEGIPEDAGSTIDYRYNGGKLAEVYYVGQWSIIFKGSMTTQFTYCEEGDVPYFSSSLKVSRYVPDFDYICEQDNRLWGVSNSDGTINEIHASALGEPWNWDKYAGIASDSYAVSIGSPGRWTGICSYNGRIYAWKENCCHRIYGNLPSNYQTSQIDLDGVEANSSDSLCELNGYLYYVSRRGIMRFDGSLPRCVSDDLNAKHFSHGYCGKFMDTLYCACNFTTKDVEVTNGTLTYDTKYGIWHRIPDFRFIGYANYGSAGKNEITFLTSTEYAYSLTDLDNNSTWAAETGDIGLELIDRKYLTGIDLRVEMRSPSSIHVLVNYDDGEFTEVYQHDQESGKMFDIIRIPITPNRCDHMRIRLEGNGPITLYSMSKIIEQGSDLP